MQKKTNLEMFLSFHVRMLVCVGSISVSQKAGLVLPNPISLSLVRSSFPVRLMTLRDEEHSAEVSSCH